MSCIQLNDLVDTVETLLDDEICFVHKESGETLVVNEDAYSLVFEHELADIINRVIEWDKEYLLEVNELIDHEDEYFFIRKTDFNEYEWMEEFIEKINPNIQNKFYQAIKRKGAFRRFKDLIYEYTIEKQWFKYHDQRLREEIKRICDDYQVNYTEQ